MRQIRHFDPIFTGSKSTSSISLLTIRPRTFFQARKCPSVQCRRFSLIDRPQSERVPPCDNSRRSKEDDRGIELPVDGSDERGLDYVLCIIRMFSVLIYTKGYHRHSVPFTPKSKIFEEIFEGIHSGRRG